MPFLPPFPGLTSLLHSRLLYSPTKWCKRAERGWLPSGRVVLSATPSSSHFPSAPSWAPQGLQFFRTICSAMEQLLLLLLFWPWCFHCCFSLFCSLLHHLCRVFCPFKNTLSQRCHQLVWWAQLCPVVGLLDPGLFPTGSLAQIPSYAWNLLWEVNFVKVFWNLKHFILYYETVIR